MLNILSLDNIDEYSDNSIIMLNPSYFKNGFYSGSIPSRFNNNNNVEDIPLCLIDMAEAFDLINEIGTSILKYILTNSLYKNRHDIYDTIIDIVGDNSSKCFYDYEQWIDNNAYPYSFKSYLEKENYNIVNFMYDSALLSMYYEMYLWAFKFEDDGYDIGKRFYKLLHLLNLAENVLNEYNVSPEDIKLAIPDANNDKKKNVPLFYNLRRLLLKLITDKTNDYEYQITKQIPFYNKDKDIYHLYNKANSIMGIAYYKLLLNITSNSKKRQKICLNPSCINFVVIDRNYRYCDECRNNGIPEMLKHRRYENSEKGKKQRHKHYMEIKEKKKQQ